MAAKFGPGGNSESFRAAGLRSTLQAPRFVRELGLEAYEYEAGNGITGSSEMFLAVGAKAREHGIKMSFHAPYFISLSSVEKEKRLNSIGYIQRSAEVSELLGADIMVVHCGSCAKISRETAMEYATETLVGTAEMMQSYGYKTRVGIETMGKINQLGTLDEVIELCKIDPIFAPVVDCGHMNARNIGGYFTDVDSYRAVFDRIANELGDNYARSLHCHFSKIEYTKAGEKRHLTFEDREFGPDFEPLAEAIVREGVAPRIICESAGSMAEDALYMKRAWQKAGGIENV